MQAKISFIKPRPILSRAAPYLELIPCPIALWSLDERFCIVNTPTSQLTGYSVEELRENTSLWIARIHPDDRGDYSKTRGKLLSGGERSGYCEYRFFPKEQGKEKWLGETSLAFSLEGKTATGIVSVYRDLSEVIELRKNAAGNAQIPQAAAIIPGFIHEMENNLQLINGSLELLRRNYMRPTAVSLVEAGVQRTDKLLRELEKFVSGSKRELSLCDPVMILKDLCSCMGRELQRQNIRVDLSCEDTLPLLWINHDDFRSAVQTVMNFSRVLLPQGGELKVEARPCKKLGERYIDLIVSSCGAVSTSVKREDVFRPFLKINGHSIGLSMVLAQQILARQDGKILFEKQAASPATFTICLRVDRINDNAS